MLTFFPIATSLQKSHNSIMGVTKTTLKEGSGAQPTDGQTVTIEYTGWLKDTSKPDSKGAK